VKQCACCGTEISEGHQRWAISVKNKSGHAVELEGYLDGAYEDLTKLADAVKPLDLNIIASPADPDYTPWQEKP
jgi:hypothetical protein